MNEPQPKIVVAELLSTGEEVRSGAVVDTNASHIAQALEASGIHVARHLCVGDGLAEIHAALAEISRRADLAVVTGGLGPTVDDRTTEAAAKAAAVSCRPDPDALAAMAAFFRTSNRTMTQAHRRQAVLPAGSRWLANPVGMAPGFCLNIGRCLCFFLPGVPREMRRMLDEGVLPEIDRRMGTNRETGRTRVLSTFGLTESETGRRLEGFEEAFSDLTLGFQIRFPEILVRILGRSGNPARLERRLDDAVAWAGRRLGQCVISTAGLPLAEAVGSLLRSRKATVALAESCTGGLMAHWLTGIAGSSDYFLFSAVAYANQAKTAVLGVPEETLNRYGAVSEETAAAMAEGARRVARAQWGLSTTGIAGPGGGSADKPVGTVCIGLAGPAGVERFRHCFPFGDRDMNKRVFAATALDKLRRALLAV